jgi:hypothetical protein
MQSTFEAEQPSLGLGLTPIWAAGLIDPQTILPPQVALIPEATGVRGAWLAKGGAERYPSRLQVESTAIPSIWRGDGAMCRDEEVLVDLLSLSGGGSIPRPPSVREQASSKIGAGYVRVNESDDINHVHASDTISLIKRRKTRSGRHAPDRCLPGQEFQPDITLLEERLLKEGADPDIVKILCTMIFHKGVTKEALKAKLTRAQLVSRRGQGIYRGAMAYNLLLRVVPGPDGKHSYCCMLCPASDRAEYKNPEDSLRHFHKDHFGMSFDCGYW